MEIQNARYSFKPTYYYLILIFIGIIKFNSVAAHPAIKIITISIKSFGAKGNGKTNDLGAFQKASNFINNRKGNVKLIIPKGTYVINTNTSKSNNSKDLFQRTTALYIVDGNNIEIVGEKGTKILYQAGQRFGAFDPKTKSKFSSNLKLFTDNNFRQDIGIFIFVKKVNNLIVSNLELDGNISKMKIGGKWGDAGIQLLHDGLVGFDCSNVTIRKLICKNFGRDGIMIGNSIKEGDSIINNNILLENCEFLYNGRQGMSWIGGSGLVANNCKFNYTGKNGVVSSSPASGVDIEAEWGLITNGVFNNCEMIDNNGIGLVADSGPSEHITLNNCTVVGINGWALWPRKPYYVFNNCKIFGPVVQAHIAENESEATTFSKCSFSDMYKGRSCYGNFLIELNGTKRVKFLDCDFTAINQRLLWLDGSAKWTEDEKPIVKNCIFTVQSIDKIKNNDYLFVGRVSKFINCKFNLPVSKKMMRGIWIQNAGSTWDKSNSIKYQNEKHN